jgi:hypothetical protein
LQSDPDLRDASSGEGARQEPGLIELQLDDARQLFHSLDPTPFPGRDLDSDAESFILGWAREQHGDAPLHVRVYLRQQQPEDARLVTDAIHRHFAALAESAEHRFRRLLAIGRRSLFIGLTFLATCIAVANWLDTLPHLPTVIAVLREGLVIGGWVALWRPLEIFLYDWWPLRAERRTCLRIAAAPIEVLDPVRHH